MLEKLVSSTISYIVRWIEFKDMTVEGWVVSLEKKTCLCLYFTKFGSCVHLLFALSQYNLLILGLPAPPRTIVNHIDVVNGIHKVEGIHEVEVEVELGVHVVLVQLSIRYESKQNIA